MNWLRRLFPLWLAPGHESPHRVGLLNTGELIVVQPNGHVKTYDHATTQLMRQTLNAQHRSAA